MSTVLAPEQVLRTYFLAKDGNRPHLMAQVFSPDASLRMEVKTDAIVFPAETSGLEAISAVLVRNFGQANDNVYSFYLERPPAACDRFSCDWLVGMTEKATSQVRVGCGRYGWAFDAAAGGRASRLHVTIEAMQVLAPSHAGAVFDWLSALPYPWTSHLAATASMPAIGELDPVRRHLKGT